MTSTTMTTVPMPGHPTPLEVAEHLVDRLRLARGVTKLTHGPREDEEAFLSGECSKGSFYLHFWGDSEGRLAGVQALVAPPGEGTKHLHLGYWRVPVGGLEGKVSAAAGKMWADLVEQDRENRKRGMHSWVPVTKLPRVPRKPASKGSAKSQPPAPPEAVPEATTSQESSVTDLFGI